jgi:nucleoside-diphosphate-sugar epimerase
MERLLITGGCGFVGSALVHSLLDKNYQITVYDTEWFGNFLKPHANLKCIKGDIRDENMPFDEIDTVIHLANIANDPSVELNPSLSWEVNVLATQQMAHMAKKSGVKQFIYASSGSVYGVKEEDQVTEDLDLVPISVYNKTKMVSERVLMSYENDFKVHCIRPATVCGWSPRMRLDVSVNMFTWQALKNKEMTVFGGNQVRPNIHIQDMVRVYEHFLENKDIENGFYNAGFENISILSIAESIKSKLDEVKITITESNDPRSYRQNSDKLIKTGFTQKYTVSDAIDDIVKKYNNKQLPDGDNCFTVKWMKHLNLNN